jgi:hypothetical protein
MLPNKLRILVGLAATKSGGERNPGAPGAWKFNPMWCRVTVSGGGGEVVAQRGARRSGAQAGGRGGHLAAKQGLHTPERQIAARTRGQDGVVEGGWGVEARPLPSW